ncbi:guanine nucleotide exchange factor [Lipomyces oligophaga]|uniref:guanine nucleotide exchange factor n=1 Tax=Lipomyces oligophaga TaxID=45792 RepID=UPI0034CFAF08
MQEYRHQMSSVPSTPAEQVDAIFRVLEADITGKDPLSNKELGELLKDLRGIGHDVSVLDTFTINRLDLLVKYGSNTREEFIRLDALRIIANALLLSSILRQEWDNAIYLAEDYNTPSIDEEFIIGRILFLTTLVQRDYPSNVQNALKAYVYRCILRDADEPLTEYAQNGLRETCKLLFNILLKFTDDSYQYEQLTQPLMRILNHLPHHINTTTSSVISCLLKLPCIPEVFAPRDDPSSSVQLLLTILENTLRSESPEHPQIDDLVTPLLLVVLKIMCELNNDSVNSVIRLRILPTDEDRLQPLGSSTSLSSLLLRLGSRIDTSTSKEVSQQLLWNASDEDAGKFATNIGLGNAIGYLVNHDIQVSKDLLQQMEKFVNVARQDINPITGQLQTAELNQYGLDALTEMTEEEKEREAERLFILFERLRANNVIKADNPLRVALESGKLENL